MNEASVRSEETPNPNSRRFTIDRSVQQQPKGRFFTRADQAEEPLVRDLFGISGVTSVMLLPASITIAKDPDARWDPIEDAARDVILRHFE